MKWLVAISLILLFTETTAIAVQAQRQTFTVGTATAARGQKATGVIAVPPGTDGALNIPVAVFMAQSLVPFWLWSQELTELNTLRSSRSKRF